MNSIPRIQALKDILRLDYPLYYWCYPVDGSFSDTSCPVEDTTMCDWLFRHSGCLEQIRETPEDAPMILEYAGGITWGAIWERSEDNERSALHVIGPCFPYGPTPKTDLIQGLKSSNASEGLRNKIIDIMDRIPTINLVLLKEFVLITDYFINNRRSASEQIIYPLASKYDDPKMNSDPDRRRIYQAEKALLTSIRDGGRDTDIVFKQMTNIAKTRPYVTEKLLQAQISVTIFTSLCVRATIEGGISPEIAYSIGDDYIRKIFSIRRESDLSHISSDIYHTFAGLTRKRRENPSLSKTVREVCDYIELHIYDDLSLEKIASSLGYTKYYLSRTFHEETKCPLNRYIYIEKIERAKVLLDTTDQSVTAISDALQFTSPSHFSTTFKKIVGSSPQQFRSREN